MIADELVEKLTSLGFSNIEARVYCVLSSGNGCSGYQIAKELQIARSSVYPALDSLCAKGFAELIPGDPNLYKATDPEELFPSLTKNFARNASEVQEQLITLAGSRTAENRYINLTGKTNIISKAINLIDSAQTEIIMNSTMPLTPFIPALTKATERGVRIILFSWLKLDTEGLPIEFYCGFNGQDFCSDVRLLLVADGSICLAASNDHAPYHPHRPVSADEKLPTNESDFIGMTSSNHLIVSLIMEHIHFDIYMLRLRAKNGVEIVTPDIQLGTIMEKGAF